MLFRLLMTHQVSWLLGLAALLVPTSVAAQDQAQTLVANPADFDFTPLELTELKLAQAPMLSSRQAQAINPSPSPPLNPKHKKKGHWPRRLRTPLPA